MSGARDREVDPPMRQEQRFELRLPAMLDWGGQSMSVNLRDMSRSGALVEAIAPPPKGASVTLSRDQLAVAARVVWVRGGRFGLHFDEAIRATDLLVQLSRSRQKASLVEAGPG